MNICTKIKQRFNELRMKGKKSIKFDKRETTERQLEELRDCGYIVKEVNNQIIIRE